MREGCWGAYEITDDDFTPLLKNSSGIRLRILTAGSLLCGDTGGRSSIRSNPSCGRCCSAFVYSERTASTTFSDAAVAWFGGDDVCGVSEVDDGA
jgi:hypothetical protein